MTHASGHPTDPRGASRDPRMGRMAPAMILPVLLAACASVSMAPAAVDPAPALQAIHGDAFVKQIAVLASDDFEGRSVGTPGEAKTVEYLSGEFQRLGLLPGNPDGSYVQAVPLAGYTSQPSASVAVGGRRIEWTFPQDYVAFSFERQAQVQVRASDLVFVGYGVKAPEYDWDDFKGVDLKGKTLIVLINDPQIPDPADPTKLDDKMFKGKAMTYYGRWTYKYEVAAALGARAVLIVHETQPAAYPYSVVVNSWSRENFALQTQGPNPDFPPVSAWITADRAKELFAAAGLDFAALKQAALRRDFKPVPLKATLDITVQNTWRNIDSQNVIGKIEGSDPKLKNQYLIYSAHWDHFGWNPKLPGNKHDQIFHGAIDNASGVAALLQLAAAYRALPVAPRRSILFIATCAEERGLLGAKFYATHPLYPLRDTVADINMDGMNLWGRTHDVEVVGYGNSDLDDVLARAAQTQGRILQADLEPERGHYYRADQFEFAKVGLPSLYIGSGDDFLGKPAGYGTQKREQYVEEYYHKVTDVVRPEWDPSGAVEDIQLLFAVGYEVAQQDRFAQWKPGVEFKARRDAMMREGR